MIITCALFQCMCVCVCVQAVAIITSTILCFFFGVVIGFMLGLITMTLCFKKWANRHKQYSISEQDVDQPSQSDGPPPPILPPPVYEDILPSTRRQDGLELRENVAYGHITQN